MDRVERFADEGIFKWDQNWNHSRNSRLVIGHGIGTCSFLTVALVTLPLHSLKLPKFDVGSCKRFVVIVKGRLRYCCECKQPR